MNLGKRPLDPPELRWMFQTHLSALEVHRARARRSSRSAAGMSKKLGSLSLLAGVLVSLTLRLRVPDLGLTFGVAPRMMTRKKSLAGSREGGWRNLHPWDCLKPWRDELATCSSSDSFPYLK